MTRSHCEQLCLRIASDQILYGRLLDRERALEAELIQVRQQLGDLGERLVDARMRLEVER